MIKHKEARLRFNNKSIIIYYSVKGEQMRFPTGISLLRKQSDKKKGEYRSKFDFDDKTQKLSTLFKDDKEVVKEMVLLQEKMDTLLKKTNGVILEYYNRNVIISPAKLQELLSEDEDKKDKIANTTFIDYFTKFVETKREWFESRGNIISLKDYNSTKSLLEAYQAYKKKELSFDMISYLWLQDFVVFCSIKHKKKYGDYEVITKGEMKPATIKKRLTILYEFYSSLQEQKVVNSDYAFIITKFNKTIKKKGDSKETLDIKEIHALYKYDFTEPNKIIIRDLFVFLCLTGIRYQDLFEFDKRFIVKSKTEEGYIYFRPASKTGIDYQIPLCKIVLEILKKYNYELPKISDQHGNRMIKEVLKETEMFNGITTIMDKNKKDYKTRYEAITLHKGRNSFITNLVEITPLNELMKYTGHKKLSTLQSYIDNKRDVKMQFIKAFDM